jgi:ABC-type glycerol-3-phosphate transport system substrate-binding protein
MKSTEELRKGIFALAAIALLSGCSNSTSSSSGKKQNSQSAGSSSLSSSESKSAGSSSEGKSGSVSASSQDSSSDDDDGNIVLNVTDEEILPYKSSPISLSFWSPIVGPDAGYFQDIIKTWNDKYGSSIYINSDPVEEEAHYTRILTSLNDNSTADITFIHKQRLARYERTGKLRDMSDITKNAGLDSSQYIDGAWDDGVGNDGKLYALTADYLPTLLFYNKKLIPEGYSEDDILSDDFTYEKMCEMSSKAYIHNRVAAKRKYGFAFNYGYCEEPFITNLYGLGATPVSASDPTAPLYDSDDGFKAVKAIESIPFTTDSEGRKVSSDSGSDHRTVFKAGRALFTMDGLWSTTSLVFHNDTVDTGIAFLPKVNSSASRLAYSDAHMFVCFNNKNVSTARDGAISLFLKYFTANTVYWCKSGKVAATKKAAASPIYKALDWSFVSDRFSSVRTPEKIYTYQTITSHAAETISEICEGKGNDGTTAYSDDEIKAMIKNSAVEAANLAKKL